jgi:two-component system, NarL family, sensor histidine kinase UhpB
LHQSLRDEAARRRVLSRQVLTLQEDERQRLARELHDELGQQLTAIRVDAVWLSQRIADAPDQARVADAIARRCAEVQLDIRALLTRLHPLAPQVGDGTTASTEQVSRLRELLEALLGGWASSATQACCFELDMTCCLADGRVVPWPGHDDLSSLPSDLVLAIYRISQEALTNVARHAQATRATLSLVLHVDARQRPRAVDWAVSDDGFGIAHVALALQRGTGLAGLQERVGALGAELEFGVPTARGLRLHARFEVPPPPHP